MMDIIVPIALLLALVVFRTLDLTSANRERDKLEMRLKRIEGKLDTR